MGRTLISLFMVRKAASASVSCTQVCYNCAPSCSPGQRAQQIRADAFHRSLPFLAVPFPLDALLDLVVASVIGRILPDETLRLQLRWDGVMKIEQMPETVFCVNVNQLEHPAEYFESLRLDATPGRDQVPA